MLAVWWWGPRWWSQVGYGGRCWRERATCVYRGVYRQVYCTVYRCVVQAAPARSLRQSYQVSQSGHFPRLALRKQTAQTASVSAQSATRRVTSRGPTSFTGPADTGEQTLVIVIERQWGTVVTAGPDYVESNSEFQHSQSAPGSRGKLRSASWEEILLDYILVITRQERRHNIVTGPASQQPAVSQLPVQTSPAAVMTVLPLPGGGGGLTSRPTR